MAVKHRLAWRQKPSAIMERRAQRGGRTALFMAETLRRLVNPFVPMDTGFLANDGVSVYARGSTGYVRYGAPYAVFAYYGAGKRFSPSKHPLASAEWDRAAASAGRLEVLRGDVQRFVRRGG